MTNNKSKITTKMIRLMTVAAVLCSMALTACSTKKVVGNFCSRQYRFTGNVCD